MRIAVIGPGRIGANVARRLAAAGHDLALSFARDRAKLEALATELDARATDPGEAVATAEVVVFSVPWSALPEALARAGSLAGKVVVDTTNQFGDGPMPAEGQTAAAFNAQRMPGARYTKTFNTLTAAFQAEVANRPPEARVVQWLCGDDSGAKQTVAELVEHAGYVPVDLGGTAHCAVMEAPRRPGAVYGEEWRRPEALGVVAAIRDGRPIPPTPTYAE